MTPAPTPTLVPAAPPRPADAASALSFVRTLGLPHPGVLATAPPSSLDTAAAARIAAVGTAVPATSYSQRELLDIFRIEDPRIRSVFMNSAIDRRFLTLPPMGPDGRPVLEIQGELLAKHKAQGVDMGARAVQECLKNAGATIDDIEYLCCVTSTGFLTPGLSALLIRELGVSPHCSRLDVVGMGCNAGLNGLNPVAAWARANPAGWPCWCATNPVRPPTSSTARCARPWSTASSATAAPRPRWWPAASGPLGARPRVRAC